MAASRSSEWTAPVRACLAGEDLDWLGGACCSVALDLPTTVSCIAGVPAPPAYLRAVLRVLGVADPEGHALRVRTAAPIASGLSTSTSLIVALVRACLELRGDDDPGPAALARMAYEIEFAFENGGGMDQLAIIEGGALLLDGMPTGLPRIMARAPWPAEIGLVVIASRQPKSTHDHVRRVRDQLAANDSDLAIYRRAAGDAATRAWGGVVRADLTTLSAAVNDAHATMRDQQRMSTALLEELRDAALAVGFAGVKVTGAGGGGALIALAPAAATPELVERLRGTLRPQHADADVLHVAATRPARDV